MRAETGQPWGPPPEEDLSGPGLRGGKTERAGPESWPRGGVVGAGALSILSK